MPITKYQKISFTKHFGYHTYSGAIEYGMRYMYRNNDPYNTPCFLISGWTEYRLCHQPLSWEPDTGNIRSAQILSAEPRISDLIPFHGWHQDGLPDNYINHSLYHYKIFRSWFNGCPSSTDIAEHWLEFSKSTLLHEGGAPIPDMTTVKDIPLLENWLKAREPFLKSRFHETMQKHGVEFITEEEMRSVGYETPLQANT